MKLSVATLLIDVQKKYLLHISVDHVNFTVTVFFRLVTYAILFGFKAHPFFGKTMLPVSSGSDNGTPKHKGKDSQGKDVYYHNCTSSPEAVREEVT